MANPDFKHTDRLQLMLVLGIVGSTVGALIAGYQLAADPEDGRTDLLLLGTALGVVASYVALIGAIGLGVKTGNLAAAAQQRVDEAPTPPPADA